MAVQPYKLSCSIYGHNGDVRSVTITKDGKIVSGSRDMTAKLWIPNESGCGYKEYLTLSSHKNFVSCVCALPPSEKFKNGLIITGSNDKLIRLYDGVQSDPVEVLKGHTNTVCKIVPGIYEETILSASWDQSAKLWNLVSCKSDTVFLGHEAAVWSVLQLPCGIIATGSADKNIKIWVKNGTCLNTLQGHTDCIRDLALSAPKEILSCSNDATVRHWNVETGQCLNIFYGHGHFIYSICCIDSMRFVTSSEDRTVKFWMSGEVVETIQIPAVSVWSVAVMLNGDIVTGSSDGVIRVFSTNPSRQASAEELLAYEQQLSDMNKKSSEKISGLDVSKLPGEEALLERGVTDGQTKVVKVGSEVLAYTWSNAQGKWDLVGHVTGSSENEEDKPKCNGKAYDYVFSVEIEPGKPLLKLPYNKNDDPWHAAQKFIHDNHLSQHFLEEVANFIIRNSNYEENQKIEKPEFSDPFTGEARYISGSDNGINSTQNSLASASKNQFEQVDLTFSSCYFPQREFLKFDQANTNQILEKLLEFNGKIEGENGCLPETRIRNLVKTCESGANCTLEDVDTLHRLLSWPQEMAFPALDVMRLSIRNDDANNYLCNDNLIPRLNKFISSEPKVTSNIMLALRVLSNMISGEAGRILASRNKSKLFEIIENASSHPGKSVQVATSTLLLNLSVMLRRSETAEGREDALLVGHRVLSNLTDPEAVFRGLVAVGTLLVDLSAVKNYRLTFEHMLLKYESDSSLGFKVQQCCQHLLENNGFEEGRSSGDMSPLVDYSIKGIEKPVKGKIDIKMLMPKIPKHIQVYIAVAFSERDFPTYSKIFNKTLSSIPNSFLIPDSLNRHYNISLSPLFFVLPNSGRFSSSIYEVMCSSFDKKRVVAILVIGESPAAFTVSLAAVTSNIPVLWARGGMPSPPGNLQQQNPLEIRLEPSEVQLLEAVRGVFLATHWHSFTVMASPSLAARSASILHLPPLNPKVVPITQNPHNIFRKLADVSRSTRGVVLLLCDLTDAILVMNVAKKLSMIDGHFVWIWIDTTTKPASFLTLPTSPSQNLTQKYTRYLKKTPSSRMSEEEQFYQSDAVSKSNGNHERERSEILNNDNFLKKKIEKVAEIKAGTKTNRKARKRRHAVRDLADDVFSKNSLSKKREVPAAEVASKLTNFRSRGNKMEKTYKIRERDASVKSASDYDWRRLASMDYLNDLAVQLDYPADKKEEVEEVVPAPVSKTWGKITEHFPVRSFGRGTDGDDLRSSTLPVGLLSVRPEPMKLDRHLLKGSVRLLVSSLHTVLKKSADRLSILDSDSSCWTKPSAMNKNFSEMYAREIRQAVGESLSGQSQYPDGDRADRSLLANFQILNLVPEKFQINFNNDDNVIEDAVLYWRQVGKVLGRSAHLNTIVWPGGDLVASALSARTRSVFRIVTALAPPFVMEGALDEDGQCLRGVICHRVLNSDKDNLTLVFNEMETQERMEDEVEELGVNERTEKPFKFLDHTYFEYQATKYKYKSSCCYGLAMDLLENVAQELEFEFHLYIIPDGAYGARNHVWEQGSPRSKWNGIVGDLVSGAAHMSFAALSVSKQRSQVIDFSTPYFFSGVSFLAAPTQKSEVPLLAFLLPFSTELWIAIFTSLNITAMAVACYEWLSPFGLNPWGRQRSRNFSIASALWVMWGLLCGHLVAFKAPKSWPNKFLINVWGGFSVIFVASYTANIAALIAGLFFHNSVSDYHDRSLLTQRVGAPRSSSADYYIHRANQHLWEHMQKYSFDDVETGISLLRNGSLDILVADTPILDYYRATDHGCKLQKIVEAINEDTYAIGMNKGFPLKESISAVISKYSNNGYMDILTEKWYGGLPCFKMTPSVELTDVGQPRPLGVAAVAGVFLLLVLGVIVGILILILEHLFYRYTLPVLRHQPKGTIWRSRNVMFFSQKLYRFINCVELVSPHHAARELVHTLRQGQITSLFQKSVKRKEHEQRRRRKSKAQFFEMIQEIRRVQQEEKEEPKEIQNVSGPNLELSPKVQLRGFLTSPRSLKHFCSSKSSVSPQMSIDFADPLNPAELLQQRKSSKSPSRLDIRRLSKELFSLPRSPKSPKIKSSSSLETRRLSSELENGRTRNDLKSFKSSEIRLSAKDIRMQTSKAIGRRLSKDASSWFTNSPPDLNSRRKSHQEAGVGSGAAPTESFSSEREKESSMSVSQGPPMSKMATLRLVSSGNSEPTSVVKPRPRLPSPPGSPVLELRSSRAPKISISNADGFNVYDTITPKKESTPKKVGRNCHGRSKSLDNKHLNFATSIVDIMTDEENSKPQTVNYATLEHKKNSREEAHTFKNDKNSKLPTTKNLRISKETDEKSHGTKTGGTKKGGATPVEPKRLEGRESTLEIEQLVKSLKNSFPGEGDHPIYAEPQKPKRDRKEEDATGPKIPSKNGLTKPKQARACSAPESGRCTLAVSSSLESDSVNLKKKYFPEYNYYSEYKKFQKSGSFPERDREFRCSERCWETQTIERTHGASSPRSGRQVRLSEADRKIQAASRRSRSVPEHRFAAVCGETGEDEVRGSKKSEGPILVVRVSRSPPRNSSCSLAKNRRRSRSRDQAESSPTPTERSRRQDATGRRQTSGHAEPP